ncbi:hypothetical protein D7030_15160 [Flavobacteriaceae bacterium AU392]|nr:hypothetical protein D1817_03330 [Flavobacteriaceae bacterium]RKM81633.1 hypothetical protein D7030_15160 [Flavobacteriaceae bacterium AU392]
MGNSKKKTKKILILGILFFLPVIFLLFLYPSTHNYNTLDVIKEDIVELSNFKLETNNSLQLEENITILGFFGKTPMDKAITALNLKELIYDNFTGFKRFQIVILMPNGTQDQVKLLKKELEKPDQLKYWQFAYGSESDIVEVYRSLKYNKGLSANLDTDNVFIIDKERNQRGRIDDRTDKEIEKNAKIYGLNSYNCIEVSEIKNKMSEDMRILFTEYRQKRKGNFDSSSRRVEDIKENGKEN